MPTYFSSHATACLTKQGLRALMKELLEAKEVSVVRLVASQIGGRLLIEADAPNQKILEEFFEGRHMICQWVMRIELATQKGEVIEV